VGYVPSLSKEKPFIGVPFVAKTYVRRKFGSPTTTKENTGLQNGTSFVDRKIREA
jgi:hypothetical protein